MAYKYTPRDLHQAQPTEREQLEQWHRMEAEANSVAGAYYSHDAWWKLKNVHQPYSNLDAGAGAVETEAPAEWLAGVLQRSGWTVHWCTSYDRPGDAWFIAVAPSSSDAEQRLEYLNGELREVMPVRVGLAKLQENVLAAAGYHRKPTDVEAEWLRVRVEDELLDYEYEEPEGSVNRDWLELWQTSEVTKRTLAAYLAGWKAQRLKVTDYPGN